MNSYELLDLDFNSAQKTTGKGVPENVVKGLPSECIDSCSQLLENGERCRLCSRLYQIGQRARRLPCRHQFHLDCIGKPTRRQIDLSRNLFSSRWMAST